MKESLAGYLIPCASQILETMFFTGVVSAVEQDSRPVAFPKSVCFQGPPDGKLCVCMQPEAIQALAAGFLGVEPAEVTAAQCEQVTGELANMICGSVLSRCAPHSFFHLEVQPAGICQEECDTRILVEMPEGLMSLCAHVDRL